MMIYMKMKKKKKINAITNVNIHTLMKKKMNMYMTTFTKLINNIFIYMNMKMNMRCT